MVVENGGLSVVLSFVLTSLSTLVVASRYYSRHFLVGKLSSPDWVILFALISTWCSVVVNWYQIRYLDISHVFTKEDFAEHITKSLLLMWIYRFNYIISLCLVKVSILLFYAYIASSHKCFHQLVRGLLIIVLIASFSMLVAGIFSCFPIEDAWSFKVFWDGFQGIHADQCYNPGILWLFNASFNLVTDVLIWTLPIPFFLNLQNMEIRRRLELVSIFSVGLLAIVASAVRLRTLVLWLNHPENQDSTIANLFIWSQVEQHTGIIASSIPFLRPIFRKAFSRTRSHTQQPSPTPGRSPAGAKLIVVPHIVTPDHNVALRTPIIPSPSPTFGSHLEPFKVPHERLRPILPIRSEIHTGHTI